MDNKQTHTQQTFSLGLMLGAFRRTALVIFALSLVINLLMLVGPIYMLQIYDRILSSGSVPTLVVISLLTLFFIRFLLAVGDFPRPYIAAHRPPCRGAVFRTRLPLL